MRSIQTNSANLRFAAEDSFSTYGMFDLMNVMEVNHAEWALRDMPEYYNQLLWDGEVVYNSELRPSLPLGYGRFARFHRLDQGCGKLPIFAREPEGQQQWRWAESSPLGSTRSVVRGFLLLANRVAFQYPGERGKSQRVGCIFLEGRMPDLTPPSGGERSGQRAPCCFAAVPLSYVCTSEGRACTT